MVPVKFSYFAPYYKQKTGRVIMKNVIILFPVFSLIFGANTVGAPINDNVFAGMPEYLIDMAHAWAGIYSEFGPSADIASYINQIQSSDVERYLNTISILGFNSTAMALFEMTHHVSQALGILETPITARRDMCPANFINCNVGNKKIVLDGRVFGAFADYDSDYNGNFNTRSTGFSVGAHGYVTNGLMLGVEYTRTMTDTHDNRVYTDATGNSISAFVKYMARSGFFVNVGANIGDTGWTSDKNIAGIPDNSVYDTNFYAGHMNTGIRMVRGRIAVTPMVSVRYIRFFADKYLDATAQAFDDWWYNTLTTSGGVDFSFDFTGNDFIVRPTFSLGGGYDVISNGTDNIHVQLIDNQFYDIPVDAPRRAMFYGGLNIELINNYFNAALDYKLNIRSGYTAHTIMANIKIAF